MLRAMVDSSKLRITLFADTPVRARAAGQILEFDTFAELTEHLLTQTSDRHEKGASGYWVAAPVEGLRSNANTRPTRVVALDWDDAERPPEPDHPALVGLRYFAHTTDSHTPDDPRWRVWLELDREYTAEEVGRAQAPIEGVYLRAASQPAFVPTRGDEMEWIDAASEGQLGRVPLVLASWGARPAERAEPPPALLTPATANVPTLASTHALVARWLSNPDGTNRLAGAVGSVLAAWGWADADIASWLTGLLGRADPRIAKHVNDAVRAAQTRRLGGTVPGLPTLEAELGVPFDHERSAVFEASVVDPLTPDGGPEVSQDGWVTAEAILAWDPPPVEWLVEGLALAPGAPVLLTGYGGSGKTTLAQHLAVCVSARTVPAPRVLGVLDVARPGPVTHIDYEQGIELTARRYRELGLERDSALRFRAPPLQMPGLGVADRGAREWLASVAAGQRLVIIDSFVAGLGAALEDENSANVREPLDWLGRVSIESGAVVLVIHHSRKTQRGGDPRQTARGSSAITDAVSAHLNYERSADGSHAMLRFAKLRRSAPAGLLAGLLGDGVAITPDLRLGRAEPASASLGVQALNVILTEGGAGLKTAQVARSLGMQGEGSDWKTVRTALDGLLADGLIRAEGEGRDRRWFPAQ